MAFNLPIFALVVLGLSAIPSEQASELVAKTCDQTMYKDFCKAKLGSAPTKDLLTLSRYTLKLTSSKGDENINQIAKAAKTADKKLQAPLKDCFDNYKDAKSRLSDSTNALNKKGYSDVNTWVSSALDSADTCEDGFKDLKVDSPLGVANQQFKQLCSIVLTMSNLLRNS